MADQATRFFERLLGGVPEHYWGYLWTLADKKSHWISMAEGPQAFATRALDLSKDSDVYTTVSMANWQGDEKHRISADASAGIFGLWADIDIADPNPEIHKKTNLPPTEEAALSLVEECGARPTMAINSGHGLQFWWIFNEFWAFNSPEEHNAAAEFARRWNATLRVKAGAHGWTVDSTFDLARVMRIPGTLNYKGEIPVEAMSRWDDGPLWGTESLGEFFLDDSQIPRYVQGVSYQSDGWKPVLDREADPPLDKHEALLVNDDDPDYPWARLWNHDLPSLENDDSRYDYWIVRRLLTQEPPWSRQEIADTLIAWRRRLPRKQDREKALRPDYLVRTIEAAERDLLATRRTGALESASVTMQTARATGDDDEVRAAKHKIEADLNAVLMPPGVSAHWVKHVREPESTYAIEISTSTEMILIGSVRTLTNQGELWRKIYDALNFQFEKMSNRAWARITGAILEVLEERSVGVTAMDNGWTRSQLRGYLANNPPVSSDVGDFMKAPIRTSTGEIKINYFRLAEWLAGRGISVKDAGPQNLRSLLSKYGAVPATVGEDADDWWTIPTEGGDS